MRLLLPAILILLLITFFLFLRKSGKALNRIKYYVFYILWLPLLCVVLSNVTADGLTSLIARRPIGSGVPIHFPILIFWNDESGNNFNARVIPFQNLDAEKTKHNNITFLLPNGDKQRLLTQLQIPNGNWNSYANLEKSGPDYQDWRVGTLFEHAIIYGRYRAYQNKIIPSSFEWHAPIFEGCSFIVFVSILIPMYYMIIKKIAKYANFLFLQRIVSTGP
nr:hypothetical protein [uncultured Holophaga sp.]